MKRQIILLICLILLTGTVLAVPSIPHAFRGDAKYTNGQNIPDGYIVTAKLDNQPISTSSVIKDGEYGYNDPLLVSDIIGDGKKVYFYINGKLVENEPVNFIIGEVTNLDLTVKSPPSDFDGCGDGYCDTNENECSYCLVDCSINDCMGDGRCDAEIGENCLTSTQDCGSCQTEDNSNDNTDGNNNGGGGGGGTSSSKDGLITITAAGTTNASDEQDDILSIESLNQEATGPGITGGVIGFVKSGAGMGLIFAVLLLIVGIGVMTFRKKKQLKSSEE